MTSIINGFKGHAANLFARISDYVQGKNSIPASPLQKTVYIVASKMINGFNYIYLSYSYCFKSKKIVVFRRSFEMEKEDFRSLVKNDSSLIDVLPPSYIDVLPPSYSDSFKVENVEFLPSDKKEELKTMHLAEVKDQEIPIPLVLPSLKRLRNLHQSPEIEASLPKIPTKTLSEILEMNRKDAESQQIQEDDKGFVVNYKKIPKVVRVILPRKRVRHRVLHGIKQELNGMSVGIASCQGARKSMQDTDIAAHQTFKIKDAEYSFKILGVFDGHGPGGNIAAAYVKANVIQYLKDALEFHNQEMLTEQGIHDALEKCCQNLDADYTGPDGTTAIIVVLLDGKIWVANVGDSRAILVKNGKAIQATQDAKPEIPEYRKTVEELGGYIKICEGGIHRVNGVLSVARAIGDKEISGDGETCCISPDPKVTRFYLKDFIGGYLVVACDGLFDVASTNEIGRAITIMDALGDSTESMSKRLVYTALGRRTQDNVTVLVFKLNRFLF